MFFISTDSAIYTFLSMELACGHTCSVFLVEMAFLIKIFLSMGPKSDQTLKNVNADRSSFFCQKNVFLSMECGPWAWLERPRGALGCLHRLGASHSKFIDMQKCNTELNGACVWISRRTIFCVIFKFHIGVLFLDICNTVPSAHRDRDILCEAELLIPVLRQNPKPCSKKTYIWSDFSTSRTHCITQ